MAFFNTSDKKKLGKGRGNVVSFRKRANNQTLTPDSSRKPTDRTHFLRRIRTQREKLHIGLLGAFLVRKKVSDWRHTFCHLMCQREISCVRKGCQRKCQRGVSERGGVWAFWPFFLGNTFWRAFLCVEFDSEKRSPFEKIVIRSGSKVIHDQSLIIRSFPELYYSFVSGEKDISYHKTKKFKRG